MSNIYRKRVEQMLKGFEVQIEKDYCMFEIEDILMDSMGDTHEAIRNILRLGKRAGERATADNIQEVERKYSDELWRSKQEINKLRRENRKLESELLKHEEIPA